jgi:hypothetical protein
MYIMSTIQNQLMGTPALIKGDVRTEYIYNLFYTLH